MIFEREKEYIEKCIARKRDGEKQIKKYKSDIDKWKSSSVLEELSEDNEEMMFEWTDIPDIYEEAITLLAMTYWQELSDSITQEEISADVLVLGKEYKKVILLSSFFLNEICEFEKYSNDIDNLDNATKYLEELLADQISVFSRVKIKKYMNSSYPIRIRIQRICEQVMLQVDSNYLFELDNSELRESVLSLGQRVRENKGNWFVRIECVKEFLLLLRNNSKGSLGHLLWICFYLAEIVYWKTGKDQGEYWDEYEINIDLVKKLYSILEIKITKKQKRYK